MLFCKRFTGCAFLFTHLPFSTVYDRSLLLYIRFFLVAAEQIFYKILLIYFLYDNVCDRSARKTAH